MSAAAAGGARAGGRHPGTGGQTAVSPAGQPRHGRAQGMMVPDDRPTSYYGRPVIKEPVWTWEIPCYLFAGGLAGASAGLGFVAGALGNRRLARRAWASALAGVTASPLLLISDLGRPERFLNMLRMVKLSSPMSVGSWVLSLSSAATGLAAASSLLGWFPRLGAVGKAGAAALGPVLATYTGVLLSDTAVPVWHEGRRELPFAFGGSAMASAGAAAAVLTPVRDAGPARRLAVAGVALEGAAMQVMERRLGDLAEPYSSGEGGRYSRASRALNAVGAATLALAGRRRRLAAVAGGAAVLAGEFCERWAVFKAGFQSARDPRYTVDPQRARVQERRAALA
ncbi:MAG: NrfD/PsrC family molybdoenzyme membrane anchor subunit [Solirubrobacteraceae bacterium]